MGAAGTATARAGGTVLVHALDPRHYARAHEQASRAGIARQLAALKGFGFGGALDLDASPAGPTYLVPSDTVIGAAAAARLGLAGPHDLFGGVAPCAVAATKAITHPLVAGSAAAPPGWSHEFPERVRQAVHPGWSAFDLGDARLAGRRLLEGGPMRLKEVRATGGLGQVVLTGPDGLDAVLARLDPESIARDGLVFEPNLDDVTTYSVGQVRVDDLVCSYVGTQRLTRNNEGAEVYGGSRLFCVCGEFDALLGQVSSPALRVAVAQARLYDEAAAACFPGLILSRRNYDVLGGRDAAGRWRSGVLEQSWRIGGASGAEVAALAAFRAALLAGDAPPVVRAATVEVYGAAGEPPPGATVYFHGLDPAVGFVSKYATVEAHGNAR
ncbi:DUF3182 family protein [Roseomonas sp. NAR14]|uniref:DUF3182 family protein n=1 Tax=Roseomonas acroporae TaxID=2937791 RepID=A0A9X1Y7T8_9PROT|nr:DUF3182 family protein [Roseomonas acroporae]MCK8784778.1 DUF3182 family protein [Roseomonas acroporae]